MRADAPGYRPLVTLSFAWNWYLSGAEPFAFHVTNIALHALAVWLAFVLAARLGFDTVTAFWAAGLFAVLPIHSEAVIWSVGRAELMATAAWSATLIGTPAGPCPIGAELHGWERSLCIDRPEGCSCGVFAVLFTKFWSQRINPSPWRG